MPKALPSSFLTVATLLLFSLLLGACASAPTRYSSLSGYSSIGYDPEVNKKTASKAYYYYLNALFLEKSGKIDSAIREVKDALFLDPHSPYLGYKLAALYERKGNPDAAMKQGQRVAADYPDFASVRLLLANLCSAKKDIPGAVKEYEAVLKLEPKNQEARASLSRIHMEMGHLDLAREILRGFPHLDALGLPVLPDQTSEALP